jgi:drug/metabolite transporter (DMT)-like permease
MVEYSLALAAILFFLGLQEINLLSRLQARQEKKREEKRREEKRAEQSRAEQSVIHSFFLLLVSHTRGHCLSGTLFFSEILYIPTFNTASAVQCSAVVSVVFSGLSPDRGKETTFKLMRLAVSCSCPSHKYSSFAAFVNLPVAKAPLVTGLSDSYKSMGIMR